MAKGPGIGAYLNCSLLSVLPQHALSALMYRAARCRWRWFKNAFMRSVVRLYGVDLDEAADPDFAHYDCFNAFFTRALKDGARPLDANPLGIVSPADGRVSQAGEIRDGQLLQAKGHHYSALELLAGNKVEAARYDGGSFATIYLSPKDYHRVHMPLTGTLLSMEFVPGDLYSVSDGTTQLIPRLFARNERVICHFQGEHGPFAVILVGAIFVGSMETVWHGEVRAPRHEVSCWRYPQAQAVTLQQGDELGRFNMGSTVILLLPPELASWQAEVQPGRGLRMGELLGSLRPATA
jgi:phosphatidylserine decarboxylase